MGQDLSLPFNFPNYPSETLIHPMPNIIDRIFQGESNQPGQEEWFYRAREGIGGPYLSQDDAASALLSFINFCKENGFSGGRNDN